MPKRDGDRWHCTRPDLAGGQCPDGPQADGSCCLSIPRCAPRRGLRARRALVARWLTLMTLALGLLFIGDTFRPDLVSPGELAFQHAEIRDCGTCHTVYRDGPVGWMSAALGANRQFDDSRRCLGCHQLGENAMRAHGQDTAVLADLRSAALPASEPSSKPLLASLSSWVFDGGAALDEALSCGSCHREHQGKAADIARMSGARCQSCHTTKFAGFADGHPRFDRYPHRRRTRLKFDHETHIAKYFADDKFKAKAPTLCRDCHVPDDSGGMMLLAGGFDRACAGCHLERDIRGAGRASANAVALLTLPGLDLEVLRRESVAIGEWPEDADGDISPFMEVLLAADPDYREIGATLAKLDLQDLEQAGGGELEAVRKLVWSIKRLLFDLRARGLAGLRPRLEQAFGRSLSPRALSLLGGALPVDAVRLVQREWLPGLGAEMRCIAATDGGAVAPVASPDCRAILVAKRGSDDDTGRLGGGSGQDASGQGDEPDTKDQGEILGGDDQDQGEILGGDDNDQDEILGGDDKDQGEILGGDDQDQGEILGGDDNDQDEILGGDDKDEQEILLAEDEATSGVASKSLPDMGDLAVGEKLGDEQWTAHGGWYRENFSLLYRPARHADGFMREWLNLSGAGPAGEQARRLFAFLSRSDTPGKCVRCHSVENGGGDAVTVNWLAARPAPRRHAFTKFSHDVHFSLLDERGCLTCHALGQQSGFMSQYKGLDANAFVGNFKPIDQGVCVRCHTAASAGETCLTCHNYHVGAFPPATVKAPLSDPALRASAAR